ncbi:MAG: nucleotidyl transferase AbiEii/AbiGii toxin family protein [Spirochaetales bacterium]|nr:nucleotidyl transferase AbiEii/AbiGii toxin family protein [Spirochaetales bacterium]
MKELNIPFYLTGGTALSRHYFQHRYSDDIDLFVNDDAAYGDYIALFYNELVEVEKTNKFTIDYKKLRRGEYHSQFFLYKSGGGEEIDLKVDLVNDLAVHHGDLIFDSLLGAVDSLENILTNKVSAVFRYEPKDFYDLLIIARNMRFDWKDIIEKSKTKEAGVDPVTIYDILKSFPLAALDAIKTDHEIDKQQFTLDLNMMAQDIFEGKENSLIKNK